MEVKPTQRGHKVTMTDKDSLWIDTGEGEMMHIFRGHKGVKITLWANEGVKYTKTTRHGTIIKLEPKEGE
tara:strand:+ start:142 stop:351 length:210 start_codon:yes stop_codon:yes gene_type:complete